MIELIIDFSLIGYDLPVYIHASRVLNKGKGKGKVAGEGWYEAVKIIFGAEIEISRAQGKGWKRVEWAMKEWMDYDDFLRREGIITGQDSTSTSTLEGSRYGV
ncbi:hypothetical protein BOTCAL_0186g00170 [Botryotinia calthae]|uniref:Uncharacterized protein n=1 Tax=Botryotinia calthae TaxID=38488 RepID=A0A4Y8D0D8_9HELO|nr:hypothetical protein BOTCAL_0186g00170 [Botryotinia calthae]